MAPIIPSSNAPVPETPTRRRRQYRVPLGMPGGRPDWRMGSAVSALIHLAIIFLILSPFGVMANIIAIEQGAGGEGPAGGGGGGNRGTGRIRAEALKFVRVAPPMPTPPKPEVKLPPPVIPQVTPPAPQPQLELVKAPEPPTMPVGTGGGSGTDQTNGSGPGSGGGVGTGVGTGRGSATGPGTGGGNQANYSPQPIEMYLPPLPTPESVRGTRVIAEFDVDASGRVLSLTFTPTKDRAYNRRLEAMFRDFRFRPGHLPDGTPIRMKAQITVEL